MGGRWSHLRRSMARLPASGCAPGRALVVAKGIIAKLTKSAPSPTNVATGHTARSPAVTIEVRTDRRPMPPPDAVERQAEAFSGRARGRWPLNCQCGTE
jgi:hypothetical protein